MNKYFLVLIILLAVVFVSGCVSDSDSSSSNYYSSKYNDYKLVNLDLDKSSISLSSNQSECIINGTTDVENVTIDCPALNISNVTVNVANGTFSYKVKNIPKATLDIFEKYEAKDAGKKRSLTVDLANITVSANTTKAKTFNDTETFTIKRVFSADEIEKDFKQSIKNVSYDELVKVNPYNFQGLRTKYSGEIISFEPVERSMVYGGFNLAVDGNRNQIIHFFYNGPKLKVGDNVTVWGKLNGDLVYGPRELSERMVYSGTSLTYGSYKGYGYSSGGFGFYDLQGSSPYYSDFYTSLADYAFQPDAYAWYVEINN